MSVWDIVAILFGCAVGFVWLMVLDLYYAERGKEDE